MATSAQQFQFSGQFLSITTQNLQAIMHRVSFIAPRASRAVNRCISTSYPRWGTGKPSTDSYVSKQEHHDPEHEAKYEDRKDPQAMEGKKAMG
jgi:hypothetical protein